jgi:hypothetical protein
MILIFNVKITDNRLAHYRNTSNLNYPSNNRIDIFKYCLASYEPLLPIISKCILYVEIEPELEDRKLELVDFIKEIYPDSKLELYFYRNNYHSQWLEVCNKLKDYGDDIIFFCGNDDHIFIDSNTKIIEEGIELLKEEDNSLSVVYYSHWLEQIKLSEYNNASLIDSGNFLLYNSSNYDSIQMMNKKRFIKIWTETCSSDDRYNNDRGPIFRPDHLNPPIQPLRSCNTYVPTKEIVRHFDGYGHVKGYSIDNVHNYTPPLFIPPGFFENKIEILYGYINRDNNNTNLNPDSEYLFSENSDGTDYRWCLEDIPAFWIKRINKIDINKKDDENHKQLLKIKRNFYLKKTIQVNLLIFDTEFKENEFKNTDWINNNLL